MRTMNNDLFFSPRKKSFKNRFFNRVQGTWQTLTPFLLSLDQSFKIGSVDGNHRAITAIFLYILATL